MEKGGQRPPFRIAIRRGFARSRTPRGASARVALEARAVAHQREVQALRAHLAFVALGFRFGAARGGGRLGVGLGKRDLRFELLGRRELALGLALERGGAGDFGACAGGGEGSDIRYSTPARFAVRPSSCGGGNADA